MAKISISNSEWPLMQVIWDRHPATAAEVVDRLTGHADWHPRTVKTLLNRLVKKGVLQYRREGRHYSYMPRVDRERCVREASRSFLRRVFGGAVGPALVQFVEEADLSPEEVERIQAILEKKKQRRSR